MDDAGVVPALVLRRAGLFLEDDDAEPGCPLEDSVGAGKPYETGADD